MRFRGTPVAQSCRGGFLLRSVIGLAAAAVVPFLLAGAFLTSPSATGAARADTPAVDHLPNPPPEPAFSEGAVDEDEAAVDVMGNRVTDAVAKYQFDAN